MGLEPKVASLFFTIASFPPDFPFCVSIPHQDPGLFCSLSLHIPVTPKAHCLYYHCVGVPLWTLMNSSAQRAGTVMRSFHKSCQHQKRSLLPFLGDTRWRKLLATCPDYLTPVGIPISIICWSLDTKILSIVTRTHLQKGKGEDGCTNLCIHG